ncbi:MAG: hypothetical protein ACKOWG_16745 [Planctomycetia bacterium]
MSEHVAVICRGGGQRRKSLRRRARASLLSTSLASLAIGALVAGLTGCSRSPSLPARVKVSGVVTYKGEPLADALIAFIPIGALDVTLNAGATGLTDEQGRYELSTFGNKDGAIPGEKQVRVLPAARAPTKLTDDGDPAPSPKPPGFPEKYLDQTASGLKATVEAGQKNTFDFALTDGK